jgi:spermidine/putrescine-binding protein
MVAIPKDAENVEAAYKFMNYLLKPEVMAGITNAVRFPNGNKAATRWWTKTSPATRHLPADEVKASCTRSRHRPKLPSANDPQLDQDQVGQVSPMRDPLGRALRPRGS